MVIDALSYHQLNYSQSSFYFYSNDKDMNVGAVCQRTMTTSLRPTNQQPPPSCPPGWHQGVNPGSCYFLSQPAPWLEAAQLCNLLGARLVVLTSQEEIGLVRSLVQRNDNGLFWVGSSSPQDVLLQADSGKCPMMNREGELENKPWWLIHCHYKDYI